MIVLGGPEYVYSYMIFVFPPTCTDNMDPCSFSPAFISTNCFSSFHQYRGLELAPGCTESNYIVLNIYLTVTRWNEATMYQHLKSRRAKTGQDDMQYKYRK